MHESRATPRLPADAAWWPAHWSVRTKISVVLLLPVLVAVALAEIRIQGELDRATELTAARDRLPVLRDTIDLTASLGEEMVAAVAVPAGAPDSLTANVDAKVAAVQRDAGYAPLPGDTGRALNTALGKLAGIRAAGAGGGDVRTKAAGYNDIIATLGDLVPAIVPADAASAETTRLLVHLRGELATEETYRRAAQNSPDDASLRPAVIQTAAEQEVLAEQAEHQLTGDRLAKFTAATDAADGRLDALQEPGDRPLAALLPSITAEAATVTGVLNDVAAQLATNVSEAADDARADSLRDTALVLGALLGALAIALLVVRSLVTPVRRLRAAALRAANDQLPETVRQIREGHEVDWRAVPDSGVRTDEEIGQLARAFDDMHRQAVRLAVEQAELRQQVSEMFMTLSRRSQSLVEQQLSIIEDLEAGEQNPRRLDELFRIDHIATRLRRNGENLHVLAGGRPVRHGREPVPTRDLLRAATSEVKDYRRVALGNAPRSSVQPEAAADVVHILAELLENATRFSPPEHKVALTADRGADGGLLIEVVDQGLGMTPEELATVNDRLAAAGTVGPETTRRMGLFVVGRLAALHGVTVRLRSTGTAARHAGVTASVHVPGALVIADLARPIGAGRLVPAGRNGHPRPPVVPAQASTPIFEQVVTSWFTEPPAKPVARRNGKPGPVEWPAVGSAAELPAASAVEGELGSPVARRASAAELSAASAVEGDLGSPVARRASAAELPVVSAADRDLESPVARRASAAEMPAASAVEGELESAAAYRASVAEPAEVSAVPVERVAGVERASESSGAHRVVPAERASDTPPATDSGTRPELTPVGDWDTPADRTRQAAETALQPPAAQNLTGAGLPTRRPGAQLAPGAVVPRVRDQTGGSFRDAAAVRSSLSRHYQGMRAARMETAARAERSGKDEEDPR
ncbi:MULTISPECIES: ATP-binding protein [unclassified Amycolatopsis]|uniref:sensor histidine kinase n=1 Tax=unclassified Amycolatopsis TaxID=2618356 RepID=UPI0028762010|nr:MULTISPECIES: ATP-binding protein [unclassified Amycolatopsis]MDS0138742.1 HAMP domain-containing protein [Amycolatopsis sp. 505]MDS0147236.1 HAMP domain-containing protein [Amycolatopsis sp. CM201R]